LLRRTTQRSSVDFILLASQRCFVWLAREIIPPSSESLRLQMCFFVFNSGCLWLATLASQSEFSLQGERGLRLVRPVAGIVSGFDFRQTPDARSVDLGDGVLDLLAFDGFLDRAILDLPLQADKLAL